MLLTIPASADGNPEATSVLDLEPLLSYLRQSGADAVSLLPPNGPDDLPNGAALSAMRTHLELQGFRTVGGCVEIAADAAVTDESWRTEQLFDLRALIAALGEAGVTPLTLVWEAPLESPEQLDAALHLLDRLLEEAERAGVQIAVLGDPVVSRWDQIRAALPSPALGKGIECAHPGSVAGDALCARLRVDEQRGSDLIRGVTALEQVGFRGPLHLTGLDTPVRTAYAIGLIKGLLGRVPGD